MMPPSWLTVVRILVLAVTGLPCLAAAQFMRVGSSFTKENAMPVGYEKAYYDKDHNCVSGFWFQNGVVHWKNDPRDTPPPGDTRGVLLQGSRPVRVVLRGVIYRGSGSDAVRCDSAVLDLGRVSYVRQVTGTEIDNFDYRECAVSQNSCQVLLYRNGSPPATVDVEAEGNDRTARPSEPRDGDKRHDGKDN